MLFLRACRQQRAYVYVCISNCECQGSRVLVSWACRAQPDGPVLVLVVVVVREVTLDP